MNRAYALSGFALGEQAVNQLVFWRTLEARMRRVYSEMPTPTLACQVLFKQCLPEGRCSTSWHSMWRNGKYVGQRSAFPYTDPHQFPHFQLTSCSHSEVFMKRSPTSCTIATLQVCDKLCLLLFYFTSYHYFICFLGFQKLVKVPYLLQSIPFSLHSRLPRPIVFEHVEDSAPGAILISKDLIKKRISRRDRY